MKNKEFEHCFIRIMEALSDISLDSSEVKTDLVDALMDWAQKNKSLGKFNKVAESLIKFSREPETEVDDLESKVTEDIYNFFIWR